MSRSVMLALRGRRLAAAFSGKFEDGAGMGKRQHTRIDQRVVHHDIGLGETGKRMQREQARIPWSCAGKPDMARLKPRKSGKSAAQAVVHTGDPSR